MRQRNNRTQLLIIAFIFFIAFIVLAGRLFQYQILDAARINAQSDKRISRKIKLPARRGLITDINGNVFAYSLDNSSVYYNKEEAEDIEVEIDALYRAYSEFDKAAAIEKIKNSDKKLVKIIDTLPRNDLALVRRLAIKAIETHTTVKRVYPNNNMASHILGFTNVDGVGLSGIEYTQEEYLKGIDGFIEARTDEHGRKLASSSVNSIEPINGYTVVMTIDQTIQYYLEEAIELGCQVSQAKKVMAVIQDSRNGYILGMASYPDFDPNNYMKPTCDVQIAEVENLEEGKTVVDVMSKYWNNPIVQQLYEPGSTFKIFIGMVGLEEGKTSNNSGYSCPGSKVVTGKTIKCWKTAGHGGQSLVDGFKNSCNVVFMNVVDAIGKEKVYEYIDVFKLNQKSGIPLGGEAKPIVTPLKDLRPVDLARIGFGHNISLTPLQMLNILSVVSNHGRLIQPTLIKEIKAEDGTVIKSFEPRDAGRVISQQTADNVLQILEQVVASGSGKNAAISGYRIAGKTGTSIKIVNGRYDDDRKVFSSFAAIAPADDPRFNLIVIVDEPQSANVHGSSVAAPIAKQIMSNVLAYLKIEPEKEVDVVMTTVPNLIGLSYQQAVEEARRAGLRLVLSKAAEEGEASGGTVAKQYPLEGALIIKNAEVYIRLKE